jgi:hypothetical protein
MKPPESRRGYSLDSDPLGGIIAHLSRECGTNLADVGIISLMSSSVHIGECLRVH